MSFTLDQVVPWGRSLDEYRRMFDISERDLEARILGCGDGPASFNAEMTARGRSVVSCDPIYAFSKEQIARRVEDTYDPIIEQVRRNAQNYVWSDFRDPDAQYHLARMMLDNGPFRDPRQAARWLKAAADKGQYQAQAVLGRMLFKGEFAPRQAARGLMWLALAKTNAGPSDTWIGELYDSAYNQATVDERAIAGDMLVKWVNGKRD